VELVALGRLAQEEEEERDLALLCIPKVDSQWGVGRVTVDAVQLAAAQTAAGGRPAGPPAAAAEQPG